MKQILQFCACHFDDSLHSGIFLHNDSPRLAMRAEVVMSRQDCKHDNDENKGFTDGSGYLDRDIVIPSSKIMRRIEETRNSVTTLVKSSIVHGSVQYLCQHYSISHVVDRRGSGKICVNIVLL